MRYFLLAVLIVAALTAVSWVSGMIVNRQRQKRGYWVSIVGGSWNVIYHEGANSLSMYFDVTAFGHPDILQVPPANEWDQTMPDWAKGRRSEIIERVIAELGTKRWVYDGYPP